MVTFKTFRDWATQRSNFKTEGKTKNPDYSFDNWLKKTLSLGDDVGDMVDDAKEKEKKLDKEKGKEKEKEEKDKKDEEGEIKKPEEPKKLEEPEDPKEPKGEAWDKLKGLVDKKLKRIADLTKS